MIDAHRFEAVADSLNRRRRQSRSRHEGLGLVYLPMGNETPDFCGGGRLESSEKYASAIVAVDAINKDLSGVSCTAWTFNSQTDSF